MKKCFPAIGLRRKSRKSDNGTFLYGGAGQERKGYSLC